MASVFVGRATETALLLDGLAAAGNGRGGLFLVAGEPGIGKSRLADDFASQARAAGAQVAWGRCWEAGGAPAYWPWTEALGTAVAAFGPDLLRERLGSVLGDLGQIVPALGGETDPDLTLGPDTARFRLFDAVVRLYRGATETAPMVVVLDDVHVADTSSLLLLQFVAGQLDDMGLVIVATYRDVELTPDHAFTPVLEQLLRGRSTSLVRLRGLDEDAIAVLIKATTDMDASARLAAQVRVQTDGNPLYVGEMARLLEAEGSLDGGFDGDRFAMPSDVRETVLRRFGHLSGDCLDVLAQASILGREFALDLLVAMAGEAVDVMAALDEAVSAHVIEDVRGTAGRLRFSHAVMSEALYDEMTSLQRRRLHHRAAAVLEERRADDLEPHLADLARHFCSSLPVGPAGLAVEYARRAGDRAVRQVAYEEGVRLFGMALDALSSVDTPATTSRMDLLLARGDAQAKAGDGEESKATFLAAADLARRAEDCERLAMAALGYGGRFVWLRAGTDRVVVPLLREALAALPEDDSVLRVRLLARLAGALRDESSVAERDAVSAKAVAMAKRIGDPWTSAYALMGRGVAIWGPRSADEFVAIATDLTRQAEEANDPDLTLDALMLRYEAQITFGRGDLARADARRHLQLADELKQPSHRWYAGVIQTIMLLLQGDLRTTERVIADTREAGQRAQAWDAEASHLIGLSMLRWEQGRLGELEGRLFDAVARYPGYRFFTCVLALLYCETGRLEESRSIAADLVTGGQEALPLDNGWLFGMTVLADVIAVLDDEQLAGDVYTALLPFSDLVGSASGEVVSGSVQRPLGLMLGVLERYDEAVAHYEEAATVHRRLGSDLWTAHTNVDHARTLIRRAGPSDRRDAASLLDVARTLGERRDLPRLLDRVDEAARLLAASGGPARQDRPGGLTKRELEVATLVARGASNREIADELVVSERTAETHVQNILTKLGFSSRSQIAGWAVAEGLGAAGT